MMSAPAIARKRLHRNPRKRRAAEGTHSHPGAQGPVEDVEMILTKPFVYIGKFFKSAFGILFKPIMKGQSFMKNMLIAQLVSVLLGMLTPDLLKKFVDMLLDFVEKQVLGTASTLDDKIVLPLCETIRKTFDIPDED